MSLQEDEFVYISLLFDVEDIVTPEADDIAREVAGIASGEGVRATFCVVGERARQWRARGRGDVVEALAQHDVGFHTDMHSVHPTILEFLWDRGWEDGVEEALRREGPGVTAVQEVFGVMPSCWGGPGNTWGPQINEAMLRLGVPAMVYAYTHVPRGDAHRFCGLLAYPGGRYVGDGEYHDTPAWKRNMERLKAQLDADRAAGRQWQEVFVGHPSRILHEEFWDGPNFAQGRNPARENWILPRRKSDSDLVIALENLRGTVRALKSMPGIEIRTIREMNALFAGAAEEPLTAEEQAEVAPEIERSLATMAGWPILPPGLDTSCFRTLVRERLTTLRRLRMQS
jgi:hypothetical protein